MSYLHYLLAAFSFLLPFLHHADEISLACEKNSDCLQGYGKCVQKKCQGFLPDLELANRIECIEGKHCSIVNNQILGISIQNNYQVSLSNPNVLCGESNMTLLPDASPFPHLLNNILPCQPPSTPYQQNTCNLYLGIPFRPDTSKSSYVKLCGCPNIDMDNDNVPCNNPQEFFIPLGVLTIHECITNNDCVNKKLLAYCTENKCGHMDGGILTTGMQLFYCVMEQQCSLKLLASNYLNESLKIIPLSSNFSCDSLRQTDIDNADAIVSPPCLLDIDNDKHCEINLGYLVLSKQYQLCTCNPRIYACNQPQHFQFNLGSLKMEECIMSSDCKNNEICIKNECVGDTYGPAIESTEPLHQSHAIPTLDKITLYYSENVVIHNKKAFIRIDTADNSNSEVIPIGNKKKIHIQNYQVVIFLNKRKNTFVSPSLSSLSSPLSPLSLSSTNSVSYTPPTSQIINFKGTQYRVSIPQGAFADWQGNRSEAYEFIFHLSADAGCPFLYISGFFFANPKIGPNLNGLFTPAGYFNNKVYWRGADAHNRNHFVYYVPSSGSLSEAWLIHKELSSDEFVAYAGPQVMKSYFTPGNSLMKYVIDSGGSVEEKGRGEGRGKTKGEEREERRLNDRPFGGEWFIWINSSWVKNDIEISCRNEEDHVPPLIVMMRPSTGSGNVKIDTEIVLEFNEPIYYGHKGIIVIKKFSLSSPLSSASTPSSLSFAASAPSPDEIIIRTDLGGHMRNKYLVIEKNTLRIKIPQQLQYGASYTLSIEKGSLTDLAYNDIGLVPFGHFYFTTYGKNCPEQFVYDKQLYTPSLVADSDVGNAHLSTRHVQCASSYSPSPTSSPSPSPLAPPSSPAAPTVRSIAGKKVAPYTCIDGKWESPKELRCMKNCLPYTTEATSFLEVERSNGVQQGDTTKIKCKEPLKPLTTHPQYNNVSRCQNGEWSPVNIQCQVMCPEFLPGEGISRYIITGSGYIVNSQRMMQCAPNTSPLSILSSISPLHSSLTSTATEKVRCNFRGEWEREDKTRLYCMYKCEAFPWTLDAEDAKTTAILGTGQEHGNERTVQCRPGYGMFLGTKNQHTITCQDGQWVGGFEKCQAICPPLSYEQQGNAYHVALKETGYVEKAYRQISCRSSAILTAGNALDTTYCLGSKWTSVSIECEEGCTNPKEVFGKAYSVAAIEGRGGGLDIIDMRYYPGTILRLSCGRESALWSERENVEMMCSEGKWKVGDDNARGSLMPEQTVVCRGKCEVPDFGYGIIVYYSGRHHGALAFSICRYGWNDKESAYQGGVYVASCQNGEWLFSSIPSCSPPSRAFLPSRGVPLFSSSATPNVGVVNNYFTGKNPLSRATNSPYSGDRTVSAQRFLSESLIVSNPSSTTLNIGLQYDPQRVLSAYPVVLGGGGEEGENTCWDEMMNGDEEGIDCGGSCTKPCSTCNDGLQNGNETGIDCGGSCPSACLRCEQMDIKKLVHQKFISIKSPLGYTLGEAYEVSCLTKHSTRDTLTMKCREGVWDPAVARVEEFCGIDTSKNFSPLLTHPSQSNNPPLLDEDLFSASAMPFSCTTVQRDASTGCCGVRKLVFHTLGKECWDVLFPGNKKDMGDMRKLDMFCSECLARVEKVLVEKRDGIACDTGEVEYVRRFLSGMCEKSREGDYCLPYYWKHVRRYQSMQIALSLSTPKFRSFMCEDTCFRQGLRVFDAMEKLMILSSAWKKKTRHWNEFSVWSDSHYFYFDQEILQNSVNYFKKREFVESVSADDRMDFLLGFLPQIEGDAVGKSEGRELGEEEGKESKDLPGRGAEGQAKEEGRDNNKEQADRNSGTGDEKTETVAMRRQKSRVYETEETGVGEKRRKKFIKNLFLYSTMETRLPIRTYAIKEPLRESLCASVFEYSDCRHFLVSLIFINPFYVSHQKLMQLQKHECWEASALLISRVLLHYDDFYHVHATNMYEHFRLAPPDKWSSLLWAIHFQTFLRLPADFLQKANGDSWWRREKSVSPSRSQHLLSEFSFTCEQSTSCLDSWIGDGYCDPVCFNSACLWDANDCLPSSRAPFFVYRILSLAGFDQMLYFTQRDSREGLGLASNSFVAYSNKDSLIFKSPILQRSSPFMTLSKSNSVDRVGGESEECKARHVWEWRILRDGCAVGVAIETARELLWLERRVLEKVFDEGEVDRERIFHEKFDGTFRIYQVNLHQNLLQTIFALEEDCNLSFDKVCGKGEPQDTIIVEIGIKDLISSAERIKGLYYREILFEFPFWDLSSQAFKNYFVKKTKDYFPTLAGENYQKIFHQFFVAMGHATVRFFGLYGSDLVNASVRFDAKTNFLTLVYELSLSNSLLQAVSRYFSPLFSPVSSSVSNRSTKQNSSLHDTIEWLMMTFHEETTSTALSRQRPALQYLHITRSPSALQIYSSASTISSPFLSPPPSFVFLMNESSRIEHQELLPCPDSLPLLTGRLTNDGTGRIPQEHVYFVEGSQETTHGTMRAVRCKAPRVGVNVLDASPLATYQPITCLNGQWVPVQSQEPLLKCAHTCPREVGLGEVLIYGYSPVSPPSVPTSPSPSARGGMMDGMAVSLLCPFFQRKKAREEREREKEKEKDYNDSRERGERGERGEREEVRMNIFCEDGYWRKQRRGSECPCLLSEFIADHGEKYEILDIENFDEEEREKGRELSHGRLFAVSCRWPWIQRRRKKNKDDSLSSNNFIKNSFYEKNVNRAVSVFECSHGIDWIEWPSNYYCERISAFQWKILTAIITFVLAVSYSLFVCVCFSIKKKKNQTTWLHLEEKILHQKKKPSKTKKHNSSSFQMTTEASFSLPQDSTPRTPHPPNTSSFRSSRKIKAPTSIPSSH